MEGKRTKLVILVSFLTSLCITLAFQLIAYGRPIGATLVPMSLPLPTMILPSPVPPISPQTQHLYPGTQVYAMADSRPKITGFLPASKTVGDPEFFLLLYGDNFKDGLEIVFGGRTVETTFVASDVASNRLRGRILGSDISIAREVVFYVKDPMGSGATSNSYRLTVNNPVPIIASISPAKVPVGIGRFNLTIRGSGFVRNTIGAMGGTTSQIYIDGQNSGIGRIISFSSTEIIKEIPWGTIKTTGEKNITVRNSSPGGGTSSPKTLQVVPNPVPTVTSISPVSVIKEQLPGFGFFPLTIHGSNFLPTSMVRFGMLSPLRASNVNEGGTQLVVMIPIVNLRVSVLGPKEVRVINPSPGGGASNPPRIFTVGNLE